MKATALTANVDARFDTAFPEACARIGCKPIDLLGVMFSESAASPAAHNQAPSQVRDKVTGEWRPSLPAERYNAVGLIQFMPATLLGLGWRNGYEAFKHLSASQQLPYVIAFFSPWQKTGAPWDSAGRLYQACFLPATLATQRDPSEVLVAKAGRLGWAYEANMTFDHDGDGRITIQELTDAIQRNAKGARWTELLERMGLADDFDTSSSFTRPPATFSEAVASSDEELIAYLSTPRGAQEALVRLGYSVGPKGVDGFFGTDSRAGMSKFQLEHELTVTGVADACSRVDLAIAIRTAA